MQAVISGRAGVALLVDGQQLSSLHAGTREIVRRRERDIPYLLGEATDLQFLDNVEAPEVSCRLEIATTQADALHLALILLDPELPQEVRCDAAGELDDLLGIAGVREAVDGVLFSRPLPDEADLRRALSCCPGRSAAARRLLVRLEMANTEYPPYESEALFVAEGAEDSEPEDEERE